MQCNAPNPYFDNETFAADAAVAAALVDFPLGDGAVECAQCNYINIGSNIQSVCLIKNKI